MKRLIIVVLFSLIWALGYSQEFMTNNDYIYGVGVGKTQEDADNQAMLALSKTLYTKIKYKADYTLISKNGKSDSDFKRTAEFESALNVEDANIYVETKRNKFIVYRYVNKKEYIENHLAIYNKHVKELRHYIENSYTEYDGAEYAFQEMEKHCLNLILGNAYMAYNAIDNPIMDCYNSANESLKKSLMETIVKYYNRDQRLSLVSNWVDLGRYSVSVPALSFPPDELFGFEYLNDNGKWVYPTFFLSTYSTESKDKKHSTNQFNSNIKQVSAFIHTYNQDKIHYRILYEIKVNGKLERLIVPEKWYLRDRFVNIVKRSY